MKFKATFLIVTIAIFGFQNINKPLPKGFVYVKDIIPNIDTELRYYTDHNFVGDTISDYHGNILILTKATAEALKLIEDELMTENMCLKVYDGYRPQGAVNHFISWAKKLGDTLMKQEFYPMVDKKDLFKSGYIASRSGHSRGSTVDLTIIDGRTGKPLDMGSPYDFFGEQSWVDYSEINDIQKRNRQLLQKVMISHGFRNYPKEWWHFTLRNEPFPSTYFDFHVE